jgi:hypothetical protein
VALQTVYQFFEGVLIENNKVKAPSMYPQDFMYYLNKSVQQYCNLRYNLFDTTQQLTDDLRVLELHPPVYTVLNIPIPLDYWHLTGCKIVLEPTATYANNLKLCGRDPKQSESEIEVKKVTSDIENAIVQNPYLQPTIRQPYLQFKNGEILIKLGTYDTNKLQVREVNISYLKKPRVYSVPDLDLANQGLNSTLLEFPEYVNNEILNVFLNLILERTLDPRLQMHTAVTQSVMDMATMGGKK